MERRQFGRVPLQLTVRLRWCTPFGPRSEIRQTSDVSRGGVLLATSEAHLPGTPVWITLPFDPLAPEPQPEIPASVVRFAPSGAACASAQGANRVNGAEPAAVALHFAADSAKRARNGDAVPAERRGAERSSAALRLSLRLPQFPWPDEVMSLNVSASGVCFVTAREYQPGDLLVLRFANGAPKGWPASSDVTARVVRVDSRKNSALLTVAVRKSA